MADQGNLFAQRNEPVTIVQPPPRPRPRQIPRWLLVIEMVLFLILQIYVGTFLIFLPWGRMWAEAWVYHWPWFANISSLGFVRGFVSGLGLLNIWFALSIFFRRRSL